MRPTLLHYLQCFRCGGNLSVQSEHTHGDHIMEGALFCLSCGYTAPIIRGIPRMVPAMLDETNHNIASRFGYEWKSFANFYDFYREQFLSWIEPVSADFFRGRVVLDAGCGKGRHVRLAAEFEAKDVIGVDLSNSVEIAFQATSHLSNAHIIQGDIFHLPFKHAFDYIYSIGVIDHTTDPFGAFRGLVALLTRGGTISVWVYGREGNGWIIRLVDPFRRFVTSRAPVWFVKALSYSLAAILVPIVRFVYRPLGKIPGIRRLLFYRDYLLSISTFPYREIATITFDHLVAPRAYYLTRNEVAEWYELAGLEHVAISRRNQNSWRGFGVRPVAQDSERV